MEWKPYGSFLATASSAKAFRFCQVLFRIWYLIQQLDNAGQDQLQQYSHEVTQDLLSEGIQYKNGGEGRLSGKIIQMAARMRLTRGK